MTAPFIIKLPQFQGPFDLLLFFIERDELDIYDIPINKTTSDFLAYLRQMEHLNIEVASEFILVASTLMRIKAKMLLPRKDLDEQGNEIDPRMELVQQLLEYKKIKDVVFLMKDLEANRSLRFSRGNQTNEVNDLIKLLADDVEMEIITLVKIVKTFQKVMDRYKNKNEKVTHKIVQYTYSIEDEKEILTNRVLKNKKMSFEQIFEVCENKIHAVFLFLSMLELVQQQVIALIFGDGINNFWLTSDVALAQENY